MTIGEKIYQLRKKAGVSQEELAQQVNVSRQAVSKWERDESPPDAEKIVLLSSIFSVSTDYLLIDAVEDKDAPENLYLPQVKSTKARKKRIIGGVLLPSGILMGFCSTLAMYMWSLLMNSPDVAPPPDFIMPVANSFSVAIVVFLVLSLLLIVCGAYLLIAYRKKKAAA